MKASEPIPNALETPVCMVTLAGRGWLLVPLMNLLGHHDRARESWTAYKMTARGDRHPGSMPYQLAAFMSVQAPFRPVEYAVGSLYYQRT